MKKEPFDPAEFGFVLQPKQIDLKIHRTEYAEQARIAAQYNFNLEKYLAAIA
jgi:hypothetical protein